MNKYTDLYKFFTSQEVSPSQIMEINSLMETTDSEIGQGSEVEYGDFCEKFKQIVPEMKGDHMKVPTFLVVYAKKAEWFPRVCDHFEQDQNARSMRQIQTVLSSL